ncbi:shikimate dehydrogenase [Streptacidiphilus pinicola]|uniref:Shikimate dehydrogenase n=1 Tax=Streptacidiphilus pinicola TaxID=2219663 RepID=A0A2X0IFH5_9ACTN|nr:shikimate dehydrogenase [Streptacidiphilus pinicola]RAG83802.1 shikimate dehydrogenase [Streptacidiphilus pinicola]
MSRLALLGSATGGALSPVLHRSAYHALGLPWTYEAIDCAPSQLGRRLDECRAGEWAGFSLTMPLKQAVVPLLDEIGDTARQTGTVNCVSARDGRLLGDNTDVHGMTAALSQVLPSAEDVVVLGGGATACSALAAAHRFGAKAATLLLRSPDRAPIVREIARRVGMRLRVRPWTEAREHLDAPLVVSTVPPGAADVLATGWRPGAGVLLDVVYRPWPTPLAAAAQPAGRTVVGGLAMLVHQAARQVELQTGCERAPLQAMFAAVDEIASDVTSISQ